MAETSKTKQSKEKNLFDIDNMKFFEGCYLPAAYEFYKDNIDNFEVFDSDIWIVTFPRSGTTWASEMIWAIMNNCDLEKAKVSNFERIRFLEVGVLFEADKSPEKSKFEALSDSINYTKKQPHPRLIKSHLPLQLLPKEIRNGTKKPKIIYVCRNPMDACVSFFYLLASIETRDNTSEFCKLFLEGKVMYGPFWNHVIPFWRMKDEPNILFLKYEDMKADLPEVIRKTSAFLGKTLSDKQFKDIQKYISFESMQKNPAINNSDVLQFMKRGGSIQTHFVRSGTVGGYKAEMPEDYIKRFKEWIKNNLAGTGLTFNNVM